ncbi:hypothetical protein CT0861_08642 [Colletotrichum tofieldiae]|uniref:Uncharacterized protein n=1 Tax=Colletotrichum tofieldiae TaxID=708197 RepID=A0A166NLW2_9PEZI|nr:hypothetical protein CT0861_08642 [Colletotrichum tofieldiae]
MALGAHLATDVGVEPLGNGVKRSADLYVAFAHETRERDRAAMAGLIFSSIAGNLSRRLVIQMEEPRRVQAQCAVRHAKRRPIHSAFHSVCLHHLDLCTAFVEVFEHVHRLVVVVKELETDHSSGSAVRSLAQTTQGFAS